MRCLACQAENRAGRRFCAACGAALEVLCPACQFANQPDERFCGGCGVALDARAGAPPAAPPGTAGERRQVTVLFCDLAGYTELTRELGAEAVHALTGRFFERVDGIIEGYGGTIDKHIGDCVMAVFGAPLAHGNDPERALRAALDVRAILPELGRDVGRDISAHIGIASGQVVASGGNGHRSYSITGDSVNLASRLTAAAEPGTILVADSIRTMLAERLDCEQLGKLAVKGFAEPVTAWRLLDLRPPEGHTDRPFVGRRTELGQFGAVLAACCETGTGQTIYLRGEAGIGKTRLVEEFQRRAEAAGFVCHTGLVLDFGAGTGRDAVRALVHGLLALEPGSPTAAIEAAIGRALAEGLVGSDQRVYLNDLLDLPQPNELRALYDAMDNAARNHGKRATVARLVERASGQRPRVLIAEDLHWADRLTLDHLASLAGIVASCRALLIMTARGEGDPLDQVWRSRLGGSPLLTIEIGPLRPGEAATLAEAYLSASSEIAHRCVERAAGNPLFLEQLLRHAEGSGETAVPGSVQSLVQARMDQLGPTDKQALQAASILGQRFSLAPLRHLIGNPAYDCMSLVNRLLIRPRGDDFLFAHALIRDAVYDSLLRKGRSELHRHAAAWFEARDPGLHAEHLDRAGDPAAPKAYLAAARQQLGSFHYESALTLAARGRALATTPADTCALTCLQGDVLHDLGMMADAGNAYAAALVAAGDDRERCRAWLGLAAVKRVTEDLDGAFADLDHAETAAVALDLKEELARVHFLRGNLYFPRGNVQAVLDEHEKSLRCARAAGSVELEAAALGGLGDAEYARGRMLTARGHFERCIALCREHGFGRIEVASLPMAAITRLYAGELAGAHADALAAVAAAERVGHQRAAVIGCHIVFFAAMSQGDLGTARQYVDKAIELSRQLGARRFEAEGLWFLGEIQLAEGQRDEAVSNARQALAISRATGMAFLGPAILAGLARITIEPEERRAALAEGEQLLAEGSISHNYIWFYQGAAESALAQREWQEAERFADALAAYTRSEPLPYIDCFVARVKALIAFGRGQRDRTLQDALQRVRARAEALGWRSLLPELERTLAAAGPMPDA